MFGKPFILLLCVFATFYAADAQILDTLKVIGSTALFIYEQINTGKEVYDKLNEIPKLDSTEMYLSLQESLSEIQLKLAEISKNVPQITTLENRLVDMKKENIQIDKLYQEFVSHLSRNYTKSEQITFAKKVTNTLPNMIQLLCIDFQELDKYSLVEKMKEYSNYLNPSCSTGLSEQQYFYQLYLSILITEFKVNLILDYAYHIKETVASAPMVESKHFQNLLSAERINNTVKTFKQIFKNSSRELWRDDPKKHKEGESYVTLDNLYRWIFYRSYDINCDEPKFSLRCNLAYYKKKKCPVLNASTVTVAKCHNRRSGECKIRQRACANLVQCREPSSNYAVCPTKNLSGRRYDHVHDGISIKSHIFNGECPHDLEFVESFLDCECICDETIKSDRYFSLKRVTSSLSKNKVVTGIQFVKKYHTIFIQIQQGKLLAGGFVSNKTNWVTVEDNKKKSNKSTNKLATTTKNDVFELNWDRKRGIALNDIELPKDYVVTGVRFIERDSFINLDVRATKFDSISGKLEKDLKKSYWTSTKLPLSQRHLSKRLDLDKLNAPIFENKTNIPETETLQYTQFTPSNFLSSDAGQSVLPYIDIQPVVTNPPIPLSGVRLNIKKNEKSGGYLMFMLKTYNVLNYFP